MNLSEMEKRIIELENEVEQLKDNKLSVIVPSDEMIKNHIREIQKDVLAEDRNDLNSAWFSVLTAELATIKAMLIGKV